MSRSVILGTLLVLLGLLLPSVASAQTQVWLSDRRYTEGIGIKVGDFELHPGVAAEFGYDSNYFLRADKTPSEDPVGALRFRLTPSFSLSTIGAQRREDAGGSPPALNFRAGIHATYDEFIPVSGTQTGKDLMKKQRNVGGVLDFNLDIFPGRVVGGNVHGTLARSIEPSNAGDTTKSFNRISPSAGAEIAFTPGQGTFDWRFGYDFTAIVFENSIFSNLNNFDHEIKTRGRWRFLPRSALTFDGRFGFINYPNATSKTSSHPMRARIGYNGLVTNSLAILAMGGWGASFYKAPTGATLPVQDFDSFIGQAEVKFLLTPTPANDPQAASLSLSALSLGFFRDFADSFIGTYYEVDRGYAKFSYFFAGRFLLVLDAGVGPYRFPTLSATQAAWTDVRVDGSVFGEYRFAKYFGVNATVRYANNLSSTVLTGVAGSPAGNFENLQWQDFQAFLGVRWMM